MMPTVSEAFWRVRMISLGTIAKYSGLSEILGPQDVDISAAAIDSRLVGAGMVFFCLRTSTGNGHNYINDAIERGTSVIVADKKWRQENTQVPGNATFLIVDDVLEALQQMALLHRLSMSAKIIGITGSNGKTSVKEILFHLLAKEYSVIKNSGNFNNHLGVPLTLFKIGPKDDYAIVEIGTNHPGEIAKLCTLAQPDCGIITNIGTAHIGNFEGRQGLIHEKLALFRYLKEHNGYFIVNSDDTAIAGFDCEGPHTRVGEAEKNNIVIGEYRAGNGGKGYSFAVNKSLRVPLSTPGKHSMSNTALAMAAALWAGMRMAAMPKHLGEFKMVNQRMEVIRRENRTIINDCYNASPESMEAAFAAAEQMGRYERRPLVFILGDMLELGTYSDAAHRRLLDHIAPLSLAQLYLGGSEMQSLASAVMQSHQNFDHFFYSSDMDELLMDIRKNILADGLILVKASRGLRFERVISVLLNHEE
jgi:UDP-N-acetylmuramoyl-tripeptide--D-alanyl-D-alanine ligase